jgi:hypothetical protein
MAAGFTRAFGFIALLGVFVGGCATDGSMNSTGAGSTTSSGAASAPSASTKNMDRVASGAVEDSLNACLARIPKDASAGQKMLAEESCRRDQATRR